MAGCKQNHRNSIFFLELFTKLIECKYHVTVEVSIILDTGFFSMDTLKILSTDTQPYLFVISAEVTVVTAFILPFDILEVLPLGVLPAVGLE